MASLFLLVCVEGKKTWFLVSLELLQWLGYHASCMYGHLLYWKWLRISITSWKVNFNLSFYFGKHAEADEITKLLGRFFSGKQECILSKMKLNALTVEPTTVVVYIKLFCWNPFWTYSTYYCWYSKQFRFLASDTILNSAFQNAMPFDVSKIWCLVNGMNFLFQLSSFCQQVFNLLLWLNLKKWTRQKANESPTESEIMFAVHVLPITSVSMKPYVTWDHRRLWWQDIRIQSSALQFEIMINFHIPDAEKKIKRHSFYNLYSEQQYVNMAAKRNFLPSKVLFKLDTFSSTV